MQIKRHVTLALTSLFLTLGTAHAETPQDFLNTFEQAAKAESADFQGFDAQRGEQFFKNTHGNDWSCASCHTDNPAGMGKHAKTGKEIKPLAPSANPERFTSTRKVEKWFKRNCNDVAGRECTTLEKGDLLTFLMTIQP